MNCEECAMLVVLAVLIFIGVIVWRLLRLEARSREQNAVIEELHQRVWQLEDLVAILHQNRESRSE
jgi:cell division protein FtsB